MTQLDLDPQRVGTYLALVMAQRTRQMSVLSRQFGETSAAVAEIKSEIADINTAITQCIRQAAAEHGVKTQNTPRK